MIRMDLNSKYTIDIGKRVQSELKSTSMYTGNWVNEEGNWRMRKQGGGEWGAQESKGSENLQMVGQCKYQLGQLFLLDGNCQSQDSVFLQRLGNIGPTLPGNCILNEWLSVP